MVNYVKKEEKFRIYVNIELLNGKVMNNYDI